MIAVVVTKKNSLARSLARSLNESESESGKGGAAASQPATNWSECDDNGEDEAKDDGNEKELLRSGDGTETKESDHHCPR